MMAHVPRRRAAGGELDGRRNRGASPAGPRDTAGLPTRAGRTNRRQRGPRRPHAKPNAMKYTYVFLLKKQNYNYSLISLNQAVTVI